MPCTSTHCRGLEGSRIVRYGTVPLASFPSQWGHGSGVLEPPGALGDHHRVALTQRDRDILDFERSWWTATSPKDVQIRERFELSATRYYQLLTELLDDGEAMSYDPLVVRRLQRQRDRRRRARLEPRVIEDDGGR
mgnify:CR=1 FL=1